MPAQTAGQGPIKHCNRLGLDLRAEAYQLPCPEPIWDVHTHLFTAKAARRFFEAADTYRIQRIWTMTQLERVEEVRAIAPERLNFIAVPNHEARDQPDTFTTDWLKRIEGFAWKGVKICKFWAAPRGFDFHPQPWLNSPIRRQAMKLARSLGMMFMTHVGDPDTWFATKYADSRQYGTKRDHYKALEQMLEEFDEVTWIAAHMGGWPEDLEFIQGLLDRHPNLNLDTSATKWMVRELSKHPDELADFCRRNAGRILFGSDNVAMESTAEFDLFASRYWALRTLMETDYRGKSPIVDPDLAMVDPSLPEQSTPDLNGAAMDRKTLDTLYHGAAERLLMPLYE